MDNKEAPASFEIDGINFSHWSFNYTQGWQEDFWLAKGEMEALIAVDAINDFRRKLGLIVPKVALIGQSYAEYVVEPWLLKKDGSDIALYRHTKDRPGVGLMFQEQERKALELLLKNTEIPSAFYAYWNDAVNSIGYSPKLVLMFSAIESLVKDKNGKKDWSKIENILGKDLTMDLYGTKQKPETGLRHRLVHGEYFNNGDSQKDYLDLLHKKVISYFNETILKENLIETNIVHPQRHPFGNKEGGFVFIRQKVEVSLAEVESTFGSSGPSKDEKYELADVDNEFRLAF